MLIENLYTIKSLLEMWGVRIVKKNLLRSHKKQYILPFLIKLERIKQDA